MRYVPVILTPFLLLPILAGASADDAVDRCRSLETPGERADCILRALPADGTADAALGILQRFLPDMPRTVLEVTDALTRSSGSADDGFEPAGADLLDLRGQALYELGRYEESGRSFSDALSLNDGSRRLEWYGLDGTRRWDVSLDIGNGRLLRAARSLQAAGRADDAAETLRRALALAAGDSLAGIDLGPVKSPPGSAVRAESWFKPLPDLSLELARGGRYSFRKDAPGHVLIVSVWATWCEPCAQELPRLQGFFESERENGLRVLAVNAWEPPEVALPFAEALGLTFPIAWMNRAADQAFRATRLPTVLVADRRGRLRGRWTGFAPEHAEQIEKFARRLLDEQVPPGTDVATVFSDSHRLTVEWLRSTSGHIDGLHVVPEKAAGGPGILVASGRSLTLYDRDGLTDRTWNLRSSPGRLRGSDPAEDGSFEVVGYRPGSRDLVSVALPEGHERPWSSTFPVFDVAWWPRPASGNPAGPVVATLEGLLRPTGPDATPREVPGISGVSALAVVGGEASRLAALEVGGRLVWLAEDLEKVRSQEVPPNSWALIHGGGAGIGLLPPGIVGSVTGSFLGADARQAVVATDSGRLVLVDLREGKVLLRARWDGISGLAAGKVTGGAPDELVVSQGRRLGVLRFERAH